MNESTTYTSTAPKGAESRTAVTYILFVTGCAIFVTNIGLILFLSKRRHAVWTTYLFLTNLAASDILMGLAVAVVTPSWVFYNLHPLFEGCVG